MRLDIPAKAHRYILQWFNGPDNDADKEFLQLLSDNPKSVIATYNFHIKSEKCRTKFGEQNTRCIQGPAIPQVFDTDNSSQEYLLWSSKVLYNWSLAPEMHRLLDRIFFWTSLALDKDSNLKVAFLLGTVGPYKKHQDVIDWFWSTPMSRALQSKKERVEFLYNVEWYQVADILKKTRLIISPHLGYGGPPYEAAAFGIPTILTSNGHPFQDRYGNKSFPEVLDVHHDYKDDKFIEYIDKLFTDKSFYQKTGNAYRDYVNKYGTYQAYLNQIDDLSRTMGWL